MHPTMVVDYPNRIPKNIAVEIDAQYQSQLGRQDTILLALAFLSLLHYQYRIRFGPAARYHPVNYHFYCVIK